MNLVEMIDTKQLWQHVIEYLEKNISRAHLLTYFQESKIQHIKGDVLTLGVSNPFALETIRTRYNDLLLEVVKSYCPEVVHIEFEITTIKKEDKVSLQDIVKAPKPQVIEMVKGISSKLLNGRYRLSNFVTGEHNELAFAVAKAVTRSPGIKYNPVFLYGGVGLGKTHLLQAIGNEMVSQQSDLKVVYTTTEQFINDMIESIGSRRTEKFRKKYRQIDVLLIDDIQFLKNKEKTQEEFFHTFNVLYDSNKQVIISADTNPRFLKGITDRLVSRFQSGMIVEITKPDRDTRMAILQQKSQEQSQLLDEEIIGYVAENCDGSIRDMEAVLSQIIARIELTNKVPTKTLIDGIMGLQQVPKTPKKKQTVSVANPESIIDTFARLYDVTYDDLIGASRKKSLNLPRQLAMYVIKKKFTLPYEDIGNIFNKRNHATIMYACKKVEDILQENRKLAAEVSEIIAK
jgi:chromosomal replication initiator protein